MIKKFNILIVDDIPENLQVLGDILEQEGCEVRIASSGPEALLDAIKAPPDLILLDVMMPDMDGFEVCCRLKDDEKSRGIPVIFVTAMSDEVNEEKGLSLGAVDYIHKPFNLLLVRSRVRNQLELQRHRNHLEELVAQRTAELAALNEALEQRVADEVLKNVEKDHLMFQQARLAATGETLSFIAHQWRQPLNNLGLEIQALQQEFEEDGFDSALLRQFVNNGMEILTFLSSTINDFSDFFRRVDASAPFDPYQMIEKSVGLVRATFEREGISLMLLNQSATPIVGYGNEFSQVLLNILANAKDALLARQIPAPMIEIRCYRDDDNIFVTVRDNGGGIPVEILGKIFDPYFTTKFQSQGTGIGLYMAKLIIEKHMGGSLAVRNTPDGAEFLIKLPLSGADRAL